MAEARRESSRKGGHARSNKARAAKELPEALTPEELIAYLSQAFRRVLLEKTEPKIAVAAAQIARTILECRAAADQPRIEDLEEQIALLRSLIERGEQGRIA